MDGSEKGNKRRDDLFSKSLRAGNRTYFFDVKSTKSNELYLTITESKRRFNNDNGKFFYEKHKLFLYPEDFESFAENLTETLEKIHEMSDKEIVSREDLESNEEDEDNSYDSDYAANSHEEKEEKPKDEKSVTSEFSDISFEDLGKDNTPS